MSRRTHKDTHATYGLTACRAMVAMLSVVAIDAGLMRPSLTPPPVLTTAVEPAPAALRATSGPLAGILLPKRTRLIINYRSTMLA